MGERAPSDTNQRVEISRLALGASRATGPIRLKTRGAAWLVNIWSRSRPNQAACVGLRGHGERPLTCESAGHSVARSFPYKEEARVGVPPTKRALVKATLRRLGCVRPYPFST